jgi:hypothetical protein
MTDNAIIQKLLEHDARFDRIEQTMVTKDEFTAFKDQVLTSLDQMMVILQRLDQERVFTNERIKRIEADLAEQQAELRQIKQVLKIA